jgi:hypothetical protein
MTKTLADICRAKKQPGENFLIWCVHDRRAGRAAQSFEIDHDAEARNQFTARLKKFQCATAFRAENLIKEASQKNPCGRLAEKRTRANTTVHGAHKN